MRRGLVWCGGCGRVEMGVSDEQAQRSSRRGRGASLGQSVTFTPRWRRTALRACGPSLCLSLAKQRHAHRGGAGAEENWGLRNRDRQRH